MRALLKVEARPLVQRTSCGPSSSHGSLLLIIASIMMLRVRLGIRMTELQSGLSKRIHSDPGRTRRTVLYYGFWERVRCSHLLCLHNDQPLTPISQGALERPYFGTRFTKSSVDREFTLSLVPPSSMTSQACGMPSRTWSRITTSTPRMPPSATFGGY